jgi:hypothetical protein
MDPVADYKYIRAWGRLMHSNPSYIEDQIANARRDKAPDDAVYFDVLEKRWVRFANVTRDDTRSVINTFIAEKS